MSAVNRDANPWLLTEDHKRCPDCAWLPKGWVNECDTCDGSGLVKYGYTPPIVSKEQ